MSLPRQTALTATIICMCMAFNSKLHVVFTMNIPIDFISPWQWVDVNVKH